MSANQPNIERRASDAAYKADMHARVSRLEQELESLTAKLDEVLDILRASKLGVAALKGLVAIGIAAAGAWAALKGIR